MANYLQIGSIYRPHGVRGMMKVRVEPIYMDELLELDAVFISQNEETLPYFIQSIEQIADDMVLLQLEDIDSKEKVSRMIKAPILASTDDIEEEEVEDWTDIVGYILIDEQMGIIGPIDKLTEMPQQVLAELHYQGKEILVPLHDDLILEVDDLERKIIMKLPEGFFDIFLT